MTGYFIGALAAAGLVTVGAAATGAVRSADALPLITLAAGAPAASIDAGKCSVRVVRNGTPGVADIVREELADGSCVCVVTTGAAAANGPAEDAVNGVLNNRECSNTPASGNEAANAAKGASFAPAGSALPVIIGATGAGGLAATLGEASKG